MHYVYKITNKINNKFYVGKRKHEDPYNDSYMGSGKLIQYAIKKYGKENFIKEIIETFNTDNEAAELEKALVTKELIESNMSYNMHEGGHGGFMHINNVPPEERINIKKLKEKLNNGEISIGGTKNWIESSYQKVREQGRLNNEQGLTSGWKHSEEWKQERSISSTGDKNSQYGTKFFIDPISKIKKRFKDGDQPDGWVWVEEYKEQQMKNSKHWYNDGSKNYYITKPNSIIEELGLVKGRIR